MSISETLRRALLRMDPEKAHVFGIQALKWGAALGFTSTKPQSDDPRLALRVFGLDFTNPLGLAAGFDKNAEVFGPAHGLGFGYTEVGSITPKPQAGNPKPRVFRLPENQAVINRMGFNNHGLAYAERRLKRRKPHHVIGVNLGKNKTSEDAAADYALGAAQLSPYADYLTINVSSPNTPGLRLLQDPMELQAILTAVSEASKPNAKGGAPPVLVKLAPDILPTDTPALASFALDAFEQGLMQGLIISNTTIERPPSLIGPYAAETGGLSGGPLFSRSTALLRETARITEGKIPLIGVGGISSGIQAYAKIRAGASLLQLYTGFAYGGPRLLAEIKRDLTDLMKADGYTRLSQAIGADLK